MQYNLSSTDVDLCKRKKNTVNQLTFGVMLAYFKVHKQFPSDKENQLSMQLVLLVAKKLAINPMNIVLLEWNSHTIERYRQEIRKYLGYRISTIHDQTRVIDYLIDHFVPQYLPDTVLFEHVRTYFVTNKIEIVSSKQLEHYVAIAISKFEQQFIERVFRYLTDEHFLLIDHILEADINENNEIFVLAEIKKDIAGAKLKNIQGAIDKINLLQQISLPESIVDSVDRKFLLKYYERVMCFSPSNIKDFAPIAKYATMAVFCHIRLEMMFDSLVDMMIKLLNKLKSGSEKYVDNHILEEVKRVDGKFDILGKLAMLNARNPGSVIEEKVYPVVSQAKLEEVIDDLQHRGNKWYQTQVRKKMHATYAHGGRRDLLEIIKTLDVFVADLNYKPIIDAIAFITKYWDESTTPYYINIPPMTGVIRQSWHHLVVSIAGEKLRINKYNYELAVLEKLKELLGFKAIWVESSYRYRNPNKDLPKDFYDRREFYYKSLDLPLKPKRFIKKLKKILTGSLKALNANIPNNRLVSIRASKSGNNIKLTPSNPQTEPDNIVKLQQEINHQWSGIHLIDILKESDLRINFTKELETVGKSSSILASDLQKRLLLCIFAIGSNTGIKRISIANEEVTYDDLRYVKKRYINPANIRDAIRKVVNSVLRTRDHDIWGYATTTVSCDSTHLFAWDQNLMSKWHFRYGKKGVMIYWHVDQKSLCIYSQLKDCTSSEVGSMIKGVIDHDTEMDMNRVFVDTHGQSVIGFAISYLLQFDLCPRLKAINKQKLYCAESEDKTKYSNINKIIKSKVNWQLIENNYDEIVKHITALKLGIVAPEVLIKRFSQSNYNHPVYKALVEIGKANKTIFLCRYLASEELRIEVHEGLNIVERVNYAMDFIFYGKLGQINTNNIEDQELAILCLHLLQACVVYINTLIIQQVLAQNHWQNRLTVEDYRALTPLFSGHINPYGIFLLDFSKRISINSNSYVKRSYTG